MANAKTTAEVLNAAPGYEMQPFETAFAAMQAEMPTVPRSRDGFNFKYAPYEEIWKFVSPVLARHGFTIRHRSVVNEDRGIARLDTMLIHVPSGLREFSEIPYDPSLRDQERGKSLTYAKRYNVVLLLGLSIEGEPDHDDERAAAGGTSAGGDF